MNITMVSEAFGGIATYSHILLQALNKKLNGEACGLWLHNRKNSSGKNVEEFLPDHGTILRLESIMDYNQLFRTIKRDPSEIIHFQWEKSLFSSDNLFWELLCRIKKYTDKKIVITLHSVYTDQNFISQIRKFLKKVDSFIVHQDNSKEFLLSEGIDTSKVTVIPHGTSINDLHINEHSSFKTKKFKVAMTGYLKKSKGFDKAISSLIGNGNLEIIVAGMVKDREVIQSINQLRKKNGFKAIVRLIPHYITDQELHSLIKEADCVIQPYEQDYYSSSGILHLAVGMGKILLVSSSPKFKELTNRIPFCEVKDNNYMKHIEKLRNSHQKVLEIEKEIRSFARETTWPIVASKTLLLYKSMM